MVVPLIKQMGREKEINYIIWQNRAFRFYIGARLLLLNEQYAPAAFCGFQSIESLMKATLIYWDRSFNPVQSRHNMKGMIRAIKNKVKDARDFECPEYLYNDKRFQSVTRYPDKGKGVLIPSYFLKDLDNLFCMLIEMVPFQFNSELIHALKGENKKDLSILRIKNSKIKILRKTLNVKWAKTT